MVTRWDSRHNSTDQRQVVEKHSALLETAHEEQLPVDADHSAMCKFEKDDDQTFEKVYKRIKRARKAANPPEKWEDGASLSDIPRIYRLI